MDVQNLKIVGLPLQLPASFSENETDTARMLPSFIELLENGEGSEVEEVAELHPDASVKRQKRKVQEAEMMDATFKGVLPSICSTERHRGRRRNENDDSFDGGLEEESIVERDKRDLKLLKMKYEREDRKELVGVLGQIAKAVDRIADKL